MCNIGGLRSIILEGFKANIFPIFNCCVNRNRYRHWVEMLYKYNACVHIFGVSGCLDLASMLDSFRNNLISILLQSAIECVEGNTARSWGYCCISLNKLSLSQVLL